MLHVWHHATTFYAFHQGLFTGAGLWIGFWNSLIHVVMYAYYAKLPGMKMIAQWITSFQLFHLIGGTLFNLYTVIWPVIIPAEGVGKRYTHIDVRYASIINMGICFSYFFLFLAFYSKRYDKSGKGSVLKIIGMPLFVQKLSFTLQRAVLPSAVEDYFLQQGLAVPEAAVNPGYKPPAGSETKKVK